MESRGCAPAPAPPAAEWQPSAGFGLALLVSAVVTILCSVQPYPYVHSVWRLEGHRDSLRGILGEALLGSGAGGETWWDCKGEAGRSCDAAAEERWTSAGGLRRGGASSGGAGGLRCATHEGTGRGDGEGVGGGGARRQREGGPEGGVSTNATAEGTFCEAGVGGAARGSRGDTSGEAGAAAHRAPPPAGRGIREEEEDVPRGPGAVAVGNGGRAVVGLNMSLIPFTGWGNLAYALFFGFLDDPASPLQPILLTQPPATALEPSAPQSGRLPPLLARQAAERARILAQDLSLHPIIHSVDHEHFDSPKVRGSPNVAVIFFDTFRASSELLRAASRRFDCFVVGSSWNAAMLRARGLPKRSKIFTVIQGVDLDVFGDGASPREATGDGVGRLSREASGDGSKPELLRGRFVVFSGGKFELRKAQDLVVAAFKSFRTANPSAKALLLFSWDNAWPIRWYASIGGGSGHTKGVPRERSGGGHDFMDWLRTNNVSGSEAYDLGTVSPTEMARAMRWADVAVFPNRCEGGTNLVAMEAMASGVASILSNNTGHMDLINAGCSSHKTEGKAACVALRNQRKLVATDQLGADPYEGWGESDVKEVEAAMYALWKDERARIEVGRRGARVIRERFSWVRYRDRMASEVIRQCKD